jgi:hypothetical protein
MAPWSVFDEILDDDATAAVVRVLPEAFTQSAEQEKGVLRTFTSSLAARSRHPAVTNMLLDAIEGRSTWYDRQAAFRAIGSRANVPAVRAVLQRIAAEDQDDSIRDEARRLLSEPGPAPN